MKQLVIGILAHVDAGKTTLAEALLYTAGSIRKVGRVDKKDAFLDTDRLEKERGITIFSKQAVFSYEDMEVTLLDTPGHVDFSAEMERTLQVLDYAILVISGTDGVQGHTKTLWSLLKKYKIPVFLFVNKMDQSGNEKDALLTELKAMLDDGCVDFDHKDEAAFYENAAVTDEEALEEYLETGKLQEKRMIQLIQQRKLFPCYFGSALKLEGVESFLDGVKKYTCMPDYGTEFGAKVFKISRDSQGNRLTHMKLTGGSLRVKELLSNREKVNQIRIYSGEKFEAVSEVNAGSICAVTGLTATKPGDGLGAEGGAMEPVLEPVLSYGIVLPEGCDTAVMLPKLLELEEENPELHIVWNEQTQQIQAQLMGQVQMEILQSLILERFGVEVTFGDGKIVYKETISNKVEGVGHFEPLRHYAEVHLILEPGLPGTGLVFASECSEDMLDKNWQRLILTHLEEKVHKGVLTGSAITDMKITLVAGRAHQKHTEGGDFRQATYRAVRQGLMQAKSVLLEPYYRFRLEVPQNMVGRAMTDLEKMHGSFELEPINETMSALCGTAPVVTMNPYQKEVIAYTKGFGRLFCTLEGYAPCHNMAEVMEEIGYEPERDLENPADSVFCRHGAGVTIPWNEVTAYMHIGCRNQTEREPDSQQTMPQAEADWEEWIDTDEVDSILERTFYANKRDKNVPRKGVRVKRTVMPSEPVTRTFQKKKPEKEYLLVDGYNIIFAWKELKELAEKNIDGARGKLMDILCNYQAIRQCELILVFDAYRLKGHQTEIFDYQNIHVVYTKEAETADQYIEKFAHENGRKYQVTVATSDGLEQIIIRGQGCGLISARELEQVVHQANEQILRAYENSLPQKRSYPLQEKLKGEKIENEPES